MAKRNNAPLDVESGVLAQLPGIAALLTADGRVSWANAAFTTHFGIERDADAWRARLDPACNAPLQQALAGRRDFALPLRLTGAADAAPTWLDCGARWRAAHDDFLCVLHDVSALKRAEAHALAQAERLRLLANKVPVGIAYYDASDFRCSFANLRYARSFGLDESSILGRTFVDVIGAEAARAIQPQVDAVLASRQPVAYERELPGEGHARGRIEVNLLPHLAEDGRPVGAIVLITDITHHRRAEQALRESEERLAKFMQASIEGIVFHKDGCITDANPSLCELTGYTLAELRGRAVFEFIAADHVAKVASVMAARQETTYESMIVDKDGKRIPVEFIVRSMERHGERMRMTIVRDIRDRRAAQARIHHLAHHDALTGLPNRMSFMEQVDPLLDSGAGGQQAALLFVDLDHFKRVNDSLGHLAGDTILQTVATRITDCLRATDLVARFGGDEFMVLLPGITQHSDVEDVARKLLAAVGAPVNADGRLISVTPSVGIAMFPADGGTPGELIKHADTAMYVAKMRGRAGYQFFDRAVTASAMDALVLESQLTQALERGEFELHYQPQVRASDGRLVGAEALIRWNHPKRGLLLPDDFIPVAEARRLMLPIGRWVLGQAAACARRWRDLGFTGVPIAVNLSTVQFQSPEFVDDVAGALALHGLSGELLELELTERMLMDDLPVVRSRLAQLKAMGIHISIDDFGTGFSSLGHLKELPIDKLKIDRSFVRDLPGDADSAALAGAIVQMARSLDIVAVAEGVENQAQSAFLAERGCDALQGEAISPALSASAFEDWAAQRPR